MIDKPHRRGTHPTDDNFFQEGLAFARKTLTDEPREIREATVRAISDASRACAESNCPACRVRAGAIAYLTAIHESNQ